MFPVTITSQIFISLKNNDNNGFTMIVGKIFNKLNFSTNRKARKTTEQDWLVDENVLKTSVEMTKDTICYHNIF